MDELLTKAIGSIPAGGWAVGISGGADSVALADLARRRADLHLHLVHLDHELRGEESRGDAELVQRLAGEWSLPLTLVRRSVLEGKGNGLLPENPQARYRAMRLHLFERMVREHQLSGVLLAHHADDQAETVLLRLVRSAGVQGLCGIPADTRLGGLRVLRPLLGVRGQLLREHLSLQGVPWREDSSNASGDYLRNRVRQHLRAHPQLVGPLLSLAAAASSLRDWLSAAALPLAGELPLPLLQASPQILSRDLLRRWMASAGVPEDEISTALLQQAEEMASDAATPARMNLPGGLFLVRKGGALRVVAVGKRQ